MALNIPFRHLTFTDKVKRLYKKSLRNLEDWIHVRTDYREQAVIMRDKFDKIVNCPDSVKANVLLAEAERHLLENQHWQPRKFPTSVGGTAYARNHPIPDWVLDYWHPLEKAMYPDYFARREQRKKEYLEWWDKTHGKPEQGDHHH